MSWDEIEELSRYGYAISNESGNILLDLLKDGKTFLDKKIPLGNAQRAKWHLTKIFNEAMQMIDDVDKGESKKETLLEALLDTVERLDKLIHIMWGNEEDRSTFCAIQQTQQLRKVLADLFNKTERGF